METDRRVAQVDYSNDFYSQNTEKYLCNCSFGLLFKKVEVFGNLELALCNITYLYKVEHDMPYYYLLKEKNVFLRIYGCEISIPSQLWAFYNYHLWPQEGTAVRANACIPFLGGGIQAMQSEGQCEEGTFLSSFFPSFLFFSILIGSEVSTRRQMVRWKLHITYLLCVCLERDSDLKRCTFSSRFALGGSAGTFTLEIWEGAETSLEGCKILGRIRKLSENDKPACSYHVSTFSDSGYTRQLPWQACRNLRQTYAVEGRSYLWL